jgi:hypothetical protein
MKLSIFSKLPLELIYYIMEISGIVKFRVSAKLGLHPECKFIYQILPWDPRRNIISLCVQPITKIKNTNHGFMKKLNNYYIVEFWQNSIWSDYNDHYSFVKYAFNLEKGLQQVMISTTPI